MESLVDAAVQAALQKRDDALQARVQQLEESASRSSCPSLSPIHGGLKVVAGDTLRLEKVQSFTATSDAEDV